MKIEEKMCITPKFRASFPHVFKAHAYQTQEAKFSVTMVFPKATDLKDLKRAVFNAATEKWGARDKWPKNLRMPFRDGNEKTDLEGYKDTIFVSASTKQRPGIVGIDGKTPIIEEDDAFYAGCYARASVIAFAYDKAGNRGVSFSLQHLQKLGDGERFSGRKRVEDVFDAVEDVSENPNSYPAETAGDEYDFG